MTDFSRFWDSIYTAYLAERLTLVYAAVSNDSFARHVFKAYSASAKLRIVAQLCTAEVVEAS